ncbi:ATP-binding protein [Nonomuraea zeae]|uniref:ATPase n=1 Tax=Nonomuraea zeae TaxID=1642303 RepID=A0A5S4GV49_9ACTN|nr:AAA family ATPase [Nonomuraea zeae]TMR36334.1 ATPase [Nonomuraea zeae]
MPIDLAAHELIGREHPAALLRAEISRVIGSHGGLVLVTGEAGIGKTTLVTSAAAEARQQGALVVGGACWDSGSAPGYWPWVQVLRALRRGVEPAEWATAEKAAGSGLAALLGEAPADDATAGGLTVLLGDAQAAEPSDGFRLYDAVTSTLVALSQRRPVVVVIDDLHAADPASLRLLEFAARQTWFERLLLIGTYRDTEVEPVDHPLRDLLSPLVAKATTITLTGLDQAGVGALMTRTAGHEPPPGLVAEVHLRTGGNPFFVEQTARLWRSGGSASAVAPGVRDALLRRLSLLPRPVSELLPVAAVLGREFHRQVLAATIALPVAHVDRLLELAVVAKLVTTRGGGVFAFAHDLVRETLYDSLDDPRDLHAAVVAAVERSPGLAGKVLPGDLARHAHVAGDRVDRGRALDLLLAAARDARGRLADEEQLGHLRRAYDLSAGVDPRRQIMIALDLGRELHHLGDRDLARRIFERAVSGARDLDDPQLTARLALTLHAHYGLAASLDQLREAHDRLVGGSVPDDRLALGLVFHLVALARQGGDDDALAFSLWTHHDIIWGPGTAGERVALTGELIDVARRTADPELAHFAAALHWVAMIEQGDPRYLDDFHHYAAQGRRSEQPHLTMSTSIDASIIATLAGRFAEAESLLSGLHIDSRHDHYRFMLVHHRWALMALQGRLDAQSEALHELRGTSHPCLPVLEALTALQTGDLDTALRRLADGEPRDRMARPLWLRFLAEIAAATHDPELCARARAELTPHRGEWVVSLFGWDVSGPYDLWLAMVDAAEERWAEAVEGFTAAARSADQMQARPWAVVARAHLADALLARDASGDAAAAESLLEGVRREAGELGMPQVLDSVRPARPEPAAWHQDGLGPGRPEPAAWHPGGLGSVHPARPEPAWHLDGHGPTGSTRDTPAGGRDAPRGSDSPGPGAAAEAATSRGTKRGSDGGGDKDGGPGGDKGSGPGGDRNSGRGGDGDSGRVGASRGEFRQEGAVWALAFAGRVAHLPDAKGLRDLHTLLSRPGDDVPAVLLLDPEGGPLVVAAARMGGDEVLDEEAKSRYRRRLAMLDEEIDRAAELGDDRRAAEFDEERAALLAELRAAAGLGGRTRRLGDEAERARKTVTARIRDVLRKLDRAHPELAAHLRASVSTGATCRYQPDDANLTWRL